MTYVQVEEIRDGLKGLVALDGGQGRRKISATPFVYRPAASIPPRDAVYGRHFVRKFMSATVAPGGVGKSANALAEAVAMAAGRDLLGVPCRDPLTVWYWGGEDPIDEIERRIAAILLYYDIEPADLGGRLFIDSGRDCEIIVATESRDGALIAEPVIEDLEETIRSNGIDVWIIDPFVSCHEVAENDNGKIGRIMRELALLADRTDSCGEVVHHVRKAGVGSQEVTIDDARGGKAFSDRCRSVRTLNRMTPEQALDFNVADEVARRIFRVDIGKSNLFPPASAAAWRLLASVNLGNAADGRPDDHVGVVERWEAPSLFHGLSNSDVLKIQQEIDRAGDYRESTQANRWVGKAVGLVMDWDIRDPSVKHRVTAMIRIWLKSKLLEVYEATDSKREVRTFVKVREWMKP